MRKQREIRSVGWRAMARRPGIAGLLVALAAHALSTAPARAGAVLVRPPGVLVSARYVAVDPNHPGTIYAATYDTSSTTLPYPGAGVFKSTDGGATWTDVGQDLPHYWAFEGLAVDAASVVYLNSSGDGIHKSTDGGATWSPPLGPGGIALVADPRVPGTVYSFLDSVGKTTDGGQTWSWLNDGAGIFPGERGIAYGALAVDPHDSSILYLGSIEKGIFKSTDGGTHWRALDMGLEPSAVTSIAVDPSHPATVWAGTAEDGLFKSTDAGEHWAAVDTRRPNRQTFAVAVDKTGAVYVGIYDCCLLVSTDGGASWSDAAPALHETFIMTFVPDPTAPGVIYVGTIQ